MQVGIGLPSAIPDVSGGTLMHWARVANDGPFSSLGVVDRLVYPNYEPLLTLAAAGAVANRLRLMTTVLLGPLRNPGILAKQVATLDALSDGRLTLGLGIGGRRDDYEAASVEFTMRGRRLEEQLRLMKSIWALNQESNLKNPMGPPPVRPGGPELLIGGSAPAALARVARWADGYIASGVNPTRVKELYQTVEKAWRTEGRYGKPRLVTGAYFALGHDAIDRGVANVVDYYRFLGSGADAMGKAILSTPAAIRDAIQIMTDIGVDELVLWPCLPELDQIDRLSQVIV